MKKQVLKIATVILLVMALTMTNFIFVGSSLISYAADNITTNQSNVNFNAYFKDENGNKVTVKEESYKITEEYLYLQVEVNKEGYLSGNITLEEGANFKLISSESEYVEKIEGNTITLHNITAGTSVEIPVKIEPVKEENFDTGLLDMESKITITGIYKDSSEKEKKVDSTRTVSLKFVDSLSQEDVINEVKTITNKILKINGEEKRIVQISWNVGLKDNIYPIKEITAKLEAPTIGESVPQVERQINLNTMTSSDYKYENSISEITLKNEKSQEGTITWKKSGVENIILTYIYDKDVEIKDINIKPEIKITLYNQKEISSTAQLAINQESKDAVVEVTTKNQENEIYKGKLEAGIERPYITRTSVKVNLAKAIESIDLQENASTYTANGTENVANIFYSRTMIKKEQFDKILGESGKITIANLAGELIGTIDANTAANGDGYLVIDYGEKEVKDLKITTTAPISEGTLEINHIKTAKETDKNIVKVASRIYNTIFYKYNQSEATQIENEIYLKDSKTQSKLTIDKEQLSTVVDNNVEMRLTLISNKEQYDLYENPSFAIELPEKVENIEITNISKIYDDNQEFAEPTYSVDGRIIKISLEGKQTKYAASTVEGITIVIQAKIKVNKTSATSDEQIKMVYQNKNAVSYENNANIGDISIPIKITAPKEITAVNSIKELSVETIGQEEKTQVMMQKGTNAKQVEAQIEVINSNPVSMNNVKIIGEFPTNDSENNMGIAISEGLNVTGADNAKVYYTENENATDDIQNSENKWSENVQDGANVKKYLITLDTVETASSIQATYKMTIPENLEYNLNATEGYTVTAINSQTGTTTTINSTEIAMETGIGPKLETKLISTVGGNTLEENGTVKNGEVIRYEIEVSNTGSEDVTNATVTGQVPEGTTLVEPMENYEYTGAAYYKETDKTSYQKTIESLKVGEKTIVTYEVRVNSNLTAGTTIANNIETQYGEAKITNKITNINEDASLRVSLKRITDRKTPIYVGDCIEYYAIIENTSDKEQKNVKVNTKISNNADVNEVTLITGMEAEEVNSGDISSLVGDTDEQVSQGNTASDTEEYDDDTSYLEEGEEDYLGEDNEQILEYKQEMNIGNMAAGETKVLYYVLQTKYSEENTEKLTMSINATEGKTESKSNLWEDKLLHFNIEPDITSNTETQFVKTGDEIEYTITLKNTENADTRGIKLIDEIPEELEIKSITIDGEEKKVSGNSNTVSFSSNVKAQSTSTIKIKTVVADNENVNALSITNKAIVKSGEETLATTPEITHIIQGQLSGSSTGENGDNTEEPEEGENTDQNGENNNNEENNNGENNNEQGIRMIVGTAWFDENSNGKKEAGEQLLPNIKVKLLNAETNQIVKDSEGNELTATTNDSGLYILERLPKGKYIVIFEYDTSKYGLTQYKASGLSESENSNAVINELNIEGNTAKVASTDIITLNDTDISNINIGLIELKNFDLKLDKYVSKILIQDASGSTVKQYDNSSMAKAELDAKRVNGSTVLIEYNIIVTNVGEVEGYAKKIVDYMPNDLQFSSELNKDWYQTNGKLYNASIANDKIASGESRTVTLTLTKSMTEDNTGLINNTAEIAEDYNELGLQDSNSTPGNKAQGENDMSSADVILSIRTGGIVYITIAIVIIAICGVIAFIIIRRKKQNNKENI